MPKGPPRKLTPEQELELVDRYLTGGETADAIAKSTGLARVTVQRTIARCGASTRPDLAKHYLTEEQKAQAVTECGEGSSTAEVAARYGVSQQTIFRALKQHGVGLSKGKRPTCTLNHRAFDELTPSVLYWMGFLFTDGCVSNDGYGQSSVRTNIAEKDLGHVEKLRAFLGSNHKIHHSSGINKNGNKTRWGGPAVSLSVRSNRLATKLAACGMEPGKPKRFPSPEVAASRDFWRGAIDGDGWLGTTVNKKYIYPHIGLSGQSHFLECFRQFLLKNSRSCLTIRPTESGIWTMATTGPTAGEIIETLYAGAVEFLDRKNVRAQSIISEDLHLFPPYVEGPSAIADEDIALDDTE